MNTSKFDEVAASPLRPPDWRFRLASALARSGQPVGARLILSVRYTVRYLRRLQHRSPLGQSAFLAGELADVAAAMELHRRERAAGSVVVQARLLAGQTPEQIGALAGLPATAIAFYRDIFFDVQSRLDQADFIVRDVIFSDVTATQVNVAVKLVAFLGRAAALNQFLGSARPEGERDLTAVLKLLDGPTMSLLDLRRN